MGRSVPGLLLLLAKPEKQTSFSQSPQLCRTYISAHNSMYTAERNFIFMFLESWWPGEVCKMVLNLKSPSEGQLALK